LNLVLEIILGNQLALFNPFWRYLYSKEMVKSKFAFWTFESVGENSRAGTQKFEICC
jgi:hypothetical protein